MKTLFRCSVVIAVLLVSGAILVAQIGVGGRIKDFSAPTKDRTGRRSVLKGEDARPAANGQFEILKPRVETFKADDSADLTIEATQCFYDNKTGLAYSESDLSLKTSDGRLSLSGTGFSWTAGESTLVISNKVRARLLRGAVLGAAQGSNTNSPVFVTAQRLDYVGERVTFTGGVMVEDGQATLKTDKLTLLLGTGETRLRQIDASGNVQLNQGEIEASGERAGYNLADGVLRLEGSAIWRRGAQKARSDWLSLNRTNNFLSAGNRVFMELPAVGLMGLTNSTATNDRVLHVESDTFEYREQGDDQNKQGEAVFQGLVKVSEQDARLSAAQVRLQMTGATNGIQNIIADGGVSIEHTGQKLTGKSATYIPATDKLEIDGSPEWSMAGRNGSSDHLIVRPRTRDIKADGNVNVRLQMQGNPMAGLLALRTNSASTASSGPRWVDVKAQQFNLEGTNGLFSGGVTIKDAMGDLLSKELQVELGGTNRLQRLIARGDVIVVGNAVAAIGQSLRYDAINGELSLDGSPVILDEKRRVTAQTFTINQTNRLLVVKGPYKIQMTKEALKNAPSLPK